MEIAVAILNITVIFLIAYWAQKKYVPASFKLYWSALLLKVISAILLGLLYKFYYIGGDTWTFFARATDLSALAKEDFSQYLKIFFSSYDTSTVGHLLYVHDRSAVFNKLLSILCLITQDNYWVSSAYMALFSFFAAWFLYVQVINYLNNSKIAAAFALFFFPSIVFWSSGLLKESLALSGLYFLTAVFLKFIHRTKISWVEWGLVLISLVFCWWLKYYWTALFLVVLITSVISAYLKNKKSLTKLQFNLLWLFLFLLICSVASFAHPNFFPNRLVEVLVSNHNQFVKISRPENLIHYYQLQPTWWSALYNSPLALFSGLFRPFFWEASNSLSLVYAVENFILLLLTLSFVVSSKSMTRRTWLLPILTYCFLLCILLALSTPNFGTLSRYRIGFLPFLVFALMYCNPLIYYLKKKISN
jgi:hypothetical protein